MKIFKSGLGIAAIIGLCLGAGCLLEPEETQTSNQITWQGSWENGTELYGTLSLTFEGENLG